MIYTAEELKIKVNKARLMSRAELNEHEENLPEIGDSCWWLSDVDENDEDYIAYAEGNYTEDEMFCSKTEANTFIRVALDIKTDNAKVGDEFVFSGYIFTVLSDSLAISNNYLGTGMYYDEDLLNYIYTDNEITCTLDFLIGCMIYVPREENED